MSMYGDLEWFPVHKKIRDEFEELNQIGNLKIGAKYGVNEEKAQRILSEMMENPTGFASSLFHRTSKDLEFIYSKIGNDPTMYPFITDLVGTTIIQILQLAINDVLLLINTSDFKQNSNDPYTQKAKSDMDECKRILEKLRKFCVTEELNFHIEKTRKQVLNLQKRLGSRKWWLW